MRAAPRTEAHDERTDATGRDGGDDLRRDRLHDPVPESEADRRHVRRATRLPSLTTGDRKRHRQHGNDKHASQATPHSAIQPAH